MKTHTIDTVSLVNQYLSKADWKVRENSNMAFSLQGLNNYLSTEITKRYWLDEIYSQRVALAHEDGDLHLHDLGLLSTYCVGWDLMDLLIEGFTGVGFRMTRLSGEVERWIINCLLKIDKLVPDDTFIRGS